MAHPKITKRGRERLELIKDLYLGQMMSMPEIAALTGIKYQTLWALAKRHGIPMRSKGDASAIAYKRGRSGLLRKSPPKRSQTNEERRSKQRERYYRNRDRNLESAARSRAKRREQIRAFMREYNKRPEVKERERLRPRKRIARSAEFKAKQALVKRLQRAKNPDKVRANARRYHKEHADRIRRLNALRMERGYRKRNRELGRASYWRRREELVEKQRELRGRIRHQDIAQLIVNMETTNGND